MRAHLDEEKEKRRNAMEAESEKEAIV